MCLAKDETQSPQKEVASPRSPWAKLLNRQVRLFYHLNSVYFHILISYSSVLKSPHVALHCCLTIFSYLFRTQNQGFLEKWQPPRGLILTSAGLSWGNSSPTLGRVLTCHRTRLLMKNLYWYHSLTSSTPWTRLNRCLLKTTTTLRIKTYWTTASSSSKKPKSSTTWQTKSAKSATLPTTTTVSYVKIAFKSVLLFLLLLNFGSKRCSENKIVSSNSRFSEPAIEWQTQRLPLDLVMWLIDAMPRSLHCDLVVTFCDLTINCDEAVSIGHY